MQDPSLAAKGEDFSEIEVAPLLPSETTGGGESARKMDSPLAVAQKEPAETAKTWGGWGGWGSISTTLTGLATATAKDISDLSSNLQSAIAIDQPADPPAADAPSLSVAAPDPTILDHAQAEGALGTAALSTRDAEVTAQVSRDPREQAIRHT